MTENDTSSNETKQNKNETKTYKLEKISPVLITDSPNELKFLSYESTNTR